MKLIAALIATLSVASANAGVIDSFLRLNENSAELALIHKMAAATGVEDAKAAYHVEHEMRPDLDKYILKTHATCLKMVKDEAEGIEEEIKNGMAPGASPKDRKFAEAEQVFKKEYLDYFKARCVVIK